MKRTGIAECPINIGARVLFRHGRVSVADDGIANATAIDDRLHTEGGRYRRGSIVTVEMIDGLGERDLHSIANGPIMDANRIYLPAGKCSEDEVRRREAWSIEE